MRRTLTLSLSLAAALAVGAILVFLPRDPRDEGERDARSPSPQRPVAPAARGLDGAEPTVPAAERARTELDPARTGGTPVGGVDGAGPIHVRCVDEAGAGIAGVRLEGDRVGPSPGLLAGPDEATTGGDGRALLVRDASAPPLPWPVRELTLQLSPPPPWAELSWHGPVPSGELVLPLVRGASLAGHVLRSDGSPIQRHSFLELSWTSNAGLEGRRQFPIETDGSFVTPPVLAGEVPSATLVPVDQRRVTLAVEGLSLAPGETLRHDFVFASGCSCTATFVDAETGEPIRGAQVRPLDAAQVALTDETGTVRLLDALGPGEEGALVFHHHDYPPFRAHVTCPGTPIELQETFEVPHGFDLSGVARDPMGAPLAGLEVTCDDASGAASGLGPHLGDAGERMTRTDASGAFLLRGFETEIPYRLTFASEELAPYGEEIRFPAAAERKDWVIPAPVDVVGRVLDADGGPVADVEVWATSAVSPRRVARTAADGSFHLTALYPGRWTISVPYGEPRVTGTGIQGTRRRALRAVDVPAGTPVELRLPAPAASWPLARLRLSIRDAASGKALAGGCMVLVSGIDNTTNLVAGPLTAGGEGQELTLPAGSYDLVFTADGYQSAARSARLLPGARPAEVTVELAPRD